MSNDEKIFSIDEVMFKDIDLKTINNNDSSKCWLSLLA